MFAAGSIIWAADRFYVVVLFFSVLLIATCGRLSWPALWTTFGRTIKQCRFRRPWSCRCRHGRLPILVFVHAAVAAAAVVIPAAVGIPYEGRQKADCTQKLQATVCAAVESYETGFSYGSANRFFFVRIESSNKIGRICHASRNTAWRTAGLYVDD